MPHQAVHVDRCEKPLWFVDLCKNESLHDGVPIIELHGRIQASGKDTCRRVIRLLLTLFNLIAGPRPCKIYLLVPFRWICENFRGQWYPDLKYSNLQDKHQVDILVQACQGFTKAGVNLLAGNDSSR